jgi:hypothetical protein
VNASRQPRTRRGHPHCCPIRSRHVLSAYLPGRLISPCLPTKAHKLRSGDLGLHEIKDDGFRVIARKDDARVRLYSRPGNDLTNRFPLIVEALALLRSRSCIIDGEAVCCDNDGRPSFRIRYRRHDSSVFLGSQGHARLGSGCRSTSISRPMAPPCSRTPKGWFPEGIVSKRKGLSQWSFALTGSK